jgi:beta-1,4-mannooligosaccharide/beta-1,4-mannosyl-N-acetylglucosamine phosphorylase
MTAYDSIAPLPNIPWEERPEGSSEVLWRCSRNPIIPRNAVPSANCVFNSAVVPYKDGFAGVFRVDNRARRMVLHRGRSDDGLRWLLDPEQLAFSSSDPEIGTFVYGYDPRICPIEGRYYISWCNGYHGPTIGMGYTDDFETFHQMENAFLPFNRNGVLFPRRINGNYAMLSRPSDTGHTPFGDIFYSESPDLTFWGRHRHVMSPVREENGWQSTKIGAGPVPIETAEGWLLIYHGVVTTCNGYVYSTGAALLDLERPWQVIARSEPFLLTPDTPYETCGNVPNVVFPVATLVDGATGRLALYYGAADTTVCCAFGYLGEIVDFVKNNAVGEGA